jgi:uncharacterized repeat protein (TIGR01451 family)
MKIIKKMKTKLKIQNQITKGQTMKASYAVFLGLTCLFILLLPVMVFAGGTPAGTVISNQAKVKYQNAGGAQMDSVLSNLVTTTVDKKAGLTLTLPNYNRIVGDSVYVVFAATLKNTGNFTDKFNLTYATQHGWTPKVYKDINRNGVLNAADTLNGVIAVSDTVQEDSSFYILVREFIPPTAVSGNVDTSLVTGQSQYDGTQYAYQHDTVTVSRVTIAGNKTVNINNPQPGTQVTYQVNYLNSGSAHVQSIVIVDSLPSTVTYNSAAADSGGGTVTFSGAHTVKYTLASLNGGHGVGFHILATVNAGVLSGTLITNSASITYVDSINGYPLTGPNAGPANSTVIDKLGWTVVVDTVGGASNHQADSVQSGMVNTFVLKLTNNGNRTDTANVLPFTSLPLTWSIYYDKNGDAQYEGTDSLISSWTSTGGVAQNATVNYIFRATPSTHTTDRSRDSANYRFVSVTAADTAKGYTITYVKTPALNLIKNVIKVHGTAKPGDTLEYSVQYQNLGSGYANSVIITDLVPTNTTYVPGSMYYSPDNATWTQQTDASDADKGSYGSGMVTFNFGVISGGYWGQNSSTQGWVKFRVIIN